MCDLSNVYVAARTARATVTATASPGKPETRKASNETSAVMQLGTYSPNNHFCR
jgi:hypothetical protein